MKKLYSTIMLLAMMVAALSLTACGGDDGEDEIGGNSSFSNSNQMEHISMCSLMMVSISPKVHGR